MPSGLPFPVSSTTSSGITRSAKSRTLWKRKRSRASIINEQIVYIRCELIGGTPLVPLGGERESIERFRWLEDLPSIESTEMVLAFFGKPHDADRGTFQGNGHREE